MASAIGHSACRDNRSVLYQRVSKLFANLATARGDGRYARIMRTLSGAQLLILDDSQPIAFHLTGGEASDSPVFPLLLDIGPDVTPRAALADKGYDSKTNRAAARARGICPAIPTKSNAKNRPKFFPKTMYKGRARIEHAFGKLKRSKRIAFRCEKTAKSFSSFVSLVCGFILRKSVHTA